MPPVWPDPDGKVQGVYRPAPLFATASRTLKDLPHPVRLDLSAGDAPDVTGVPEFEQLLTTLGTGRLVHRFTLYRGENRNSIRTLSFPAGLYWVYADQ